MFRVSIDYSEKNFDLMQKKKRKKVSPQTEQIYRWLGSKGKEAITRVQKKKFLEKKDEFLFCLRELVRTAIHNWLQILGHCKIGKKPIV